MKFIHYLIAVLAVFGIMVSSAFALTISPAKIEITGDSGQTVQGQFLIINEQKESKTFYTSAENFEAQGETGTPNFVVGNTGLASWISVDKEISLLPGEQKTVPFSVTVPAGQEPLDLLLLQQGV